MSKSESKNKTYVNVQKFLEQYKTILICEIKDLPADMVHTMRKLFRALNSEIVCGKTVNNFFYFRPSLENPLMTSLKKERLYLHTLLLTLSDKFQKSFQIYKL